MASYHLSVKTIKRSAGRSATAAAAYLITCEREGREHDYTAKRGVEACFILAPDAAPDWAQDCAALWNAAEARETGSNSVTAREWELALPSEISDAARIEIARAFAAQLVERYGMAADVARGPAAFRSWSVPIAIWGRWWQRGACGPTCTPG